ncbi:hypothetical protein F4803DRAFT_533708 [Xylaria telfairii]|nr:hypothetical protein F4803DRAFT_533708 [Xylaria telfairii]
MSGPNGENMSPANDDSSTKSANVNGNVNGNTNGNTNGITVTPKTKTKNKDKARGRAHDMLAYTQRQVDRVMSPSTRQKAIDSTTAFASKRPLLSLFIAAQLLTALLPVVLFATFVLSTFTCAIAFALFWNGVALLVLVPTLFLTFALAVLVWLWAVGTYVVFRAVYARLPSRVRGGGNDNKADRHVIFHNKNAAHFDAAVNAEAHEARE